MRPLQSFLNAGIVHRIGPFRLHVDIARQLASQGYTTLRLDLSGLGESKPRTGKLENDDRALLDVTDAMDFLESELGTHSFSLIGLCSGAFNAHHVTLKDKRVTGAVFLDGLVFPTLGFFLRHRIGRLVRPRFWRNLIKRRFAGEDESSDSSASGLAESEFFGGEYSQEEVTRDIISMRDRKRPDAFCLDRGI